jgi:hypothetical protein
MAHYPRRASGTHAYTDDHLASRALFDALVTRLGEPEMAERPEHTVEEFITGSGRDVLKQMLQDHLDVRAATEPRLAEVAGADRVVRRRAERGHCRLLGTTVCQVEVTRIAYRNPGCPICTPPTPGSPCRRAATPTRYRRRWSASRSACPRGGIRGIPATRRTRGPCALSLAGPSRKGISSRRRDIQKFLRYRSSPHAQAQIAADAAGCRPTVAQARQERGRARTAARPCALRGRSRRPGHADAAGAGLPLPGTATTSRTTHRAIPPGTSPTRAPTSIHGATWHKGPTLYSGTHRSAAPTPPGRVPARRQPLAPHHLTPHTGQQANADAPEGASPRHRAVSRDKSADIKTANEH